MSDVHAKSLEYLLNETKEARQDLFLIDLVRKADSATAADTMAQELDYPTHLCRQIRLLFQMREQHYPAWKDIAVPCPVNPKPLLVHAYPCEWEIESTQGHIEGSAQAGTLLVTKNAAKAAVLWDYALLDDSGIEIAYSKNLNHVWFLKEGYRQVNCYPNCGSLLMPRTGLKISFSALVNSLHFWRNTNNTRLHWQRYLYGPSKMKQPCIDRTETDHSRRDRRYTIQLRPLSNDDCGVHFVNENSWGLFITMSFLKERKPIKSFTELHPKKPRLIRYTVTNGYVIPDSSLRNYLQWQKDSFGIERFHSWKTGSIHRNYGTWDLVPEAVSKSDEKRMEEMYDISEGSTEDHLAFFDSLLPEKVNGVEIISHLFDLRKSFGTFSPRELDK